MFVWSTSRNQTCKGHRHRPLACTGSLHTGVERKITVGIVEDGAVLSVANHHGEVVSKHPGIQQGRQVIQFVNS